MTPSFLPPASSVPFKMLQPSRARRWWSRKSASAFSHSLQGTVWPGHSQEKPRVQWDRGSRSWAWPTYKKQCSRLITQLMEQNSDGRAICNDDCDASPAKTMACDITRCSAVIYVNWHIQYIYFIHRSVMVNESLHVISRVPCAAVIQWQLVLNLRSFIKGLTLLFCTLGCGNPSWACCDFCQAAGFAGLLLEVQIWQFFSAVSF